MLRHFALWSLFFTALFASALSAKAVATAPTSVEFRAKGGGRVWVYLPIDVPADAKVACILVPPAGSRMYHGMLLEDSDRKEHYPYVRAGFAVVSFDISGPWLDTKTNAALKKAAGDFQKAQFGVKDALDALQLALAKYPQIDPKRIYVAGHSSAGTLALQIAASSDQLRGCAAYAPITDVATDRKATLVAINALIPGFFDAIRLASPNNRIAALRCPIFLFHATDDGRVLPEGIFAFKDSLLIQGKSVTYVAVDSGGHYDSMINQGIPQAIVWFKTLDAKVADR
jgi:dienelactone hydrolase